MFYYVTKENVANEKEDPGSQPRSSGPEFDDAQDPPLFLWNQALYVIVQLLTSNLLHINELDPIRRYLPSYNRPKRPGRYSAFQVKKSFTIFFLSFYSRYTILNQIKLSNISGMIIIIYRRC